eukprot:scaffold70017_cov25-Tisochrysis_lutea.AAC.1
MARFRKRRFRSFCQKVLNPDILDLCTRFPNGKCPMNIKGKACNRSHDAFPGACAWDQGASVRSSALSRAWPERGEGRGGEGRSDSSAH